MSVISGGIAAIEELRNKLEEAQVRRLRLETRCKTISTTVTNMEKLLSDLNGTIGHLDEELQNVNKWNNFYDGNLQDAYRSLSMLKETRDKKWKQYELDAKNIRMKIAEKEKQLEERKESYERNVELIWKKIPTFLIKEEKALAIKSLTDRMKNMGIQKSPQVTNDELQNATNKKLELESQLKTRRLELENWQKKVTENLAKPSCPEETSHALNNELKKVKAIEMALQTKVSEAKQSDKENDKKEDKSIDLECNTAGDSGVAMSIDGDIPQDQDEVVNNSVNDQSLDSTMFEERPPSPKKAELLKTPSKNEVLRNVGPMHSTPHNLTSKLSEFLRPQKSSHCSVPPNVTPIINSSLSTSRMITPMNTLQKLETKSSVGNVQNFRHITPLKKTISTAYTGEVTPVKTNFISSLPKTPISMINKSKSMILPSSKNKDFGMNKGLLAPTPEKENVLNVTPPKQILPAPATPSAPIKNSPALPNRISMASNQPDPKKLKPSNSFTKVQKPLSPQHSVTQQPTMPGTTTCKVVSSTPKKPNERGDYEDAKFPRVGNTDLNQHPVKNALMFGSMGTDSPTANVGDNQEKLSQDSSPFGGFDFPGGATFGENGTFGSGQAFGDGQAFGGETGFNAGDGFAGESNFEGGSAFGGSAGFGSASGDSTSFSSGFGGFNF